MLQKPEDEVRTLTEPGKAPIHLSTEFAEARRSGVAEMLFDIAMTRLLRVEI
jgi:hypothetical protein